MGAIQFVYTVSLTAFMVLNQRSAVLHWDDHGLFQADVSSSVSYFWCVSSIASCNSKQHCILCPFSCWGKIIIEILVFLMRLCHSPGPDPRRTCRFYRLSISLFAQVIHKLSTHHFIGLCRGTIEWKDWNSIIICRCPPGPFLWNVSLFISTLLME